MSYDRTRMPHIAYIALGANLGNREETLRAALNQIEGVVAVSGFLENPAVGGPADSPAFINAAAKVQTDRSPQDLLKHLLNVEQNLGRQRREKWGPRVIDLDLLLYDNQVVDSDGLIVPHPLMHQRRFVLQPLAEIAGDVPHPVMLKTIRQLLAELESPTY